MMATVAQRVRRILAEELSWPIEDVKKKDNLQEKFGVIPADFF